MGPPLSVQIKKIQENYQIVQEIIEQLFKLAILYTPQCV